MIHGSCYPCIWYDDRYDTCEKISNGLKCTGLQIMTDCHTDCVICPSKLVCSKSPFGVGVGVNDYPGILYDVE